MMKQVKAAFLHTSLGPFGAMILNLLTAFVIYSVARAEFLFENYNYFSDNLSVSHLTELFYGSYTFDRFAIAYTNALYILLTLFPLWIRERRGYYSLRKWVFAVVNALTLIINLCGSVYFPHTLRCTTTSVLSEFRNENNLADMFWGGFVGHWYLALLAIVIITLPWKLYATPHIAHTYYAIATQRRKFDLIQFILLVLLAPLIIGACRSGLASGIRPITVGNANQYVRRPTECALVLNTPFSLIGTIGKSVFDVPAYYFNLEAAAKVSTPVRRSRSIYAFQEKNVMVLIVESLGHEHTRAFN